jgi:hypothetical protein
LPHQIDGVQVSEVIDNRIQAVG